MNNYRQNLSSRHTSELNQDIDIFSVADILATEVKRTISKVIERISHVRTINIA